MTNEEVKQAWDLETKRLAKVYDEFARQYPDLFSRLERIEFHLPEGWTELFANLLKRLDTRRNVYLKQVKQKFGSMVVHIDVEDEEQWTELYTLCQSFRIVSNSVCEECGKWGASLNSSGFIQALCPKCREDKEPKEEPVKSVTVIVKSTNGKYLGVSRKNDYEDFGFAGGKVEKDETPQIAAFRELREETGLKVKKISLADVRTYVNKTKNPPIVEEVYCYLVTPFGDLKSNEELMAEGEGIIKWVDKEILVKGSFGDYNKAIIEALDL